MHGVVIIMVVRRMMDDVLICHGVGHYWPGQFITGYVVQETSGTRLTESRYIVLSTARRNYTERSLPFAAVPMRRKNPLRINKKLFISALDIFYGSPSSFILGWNSFRTATFYVFGGKVPGKVIRNEQGCDMSSAKSL